VYIPSASLDVTVKDQDGNVLFTNSKEYRLYDLYVKALDPKPEEVMLPIWRYDRQLHLHKGVEPFETDSEILVVPLKENTSSATVEVSFSFSPEDGQRILWDKKSKTINFTE